MGRHRKRKEPRSDHWRELFWEIFTVSVFTGMAVTGMVIGPILILR